MIEREAVRDARPAVVRQHLEALVAQRLHHVQGVARHLALRVLRGPLARGPARPVDGRPCGEILLGRPRKSIALDGCMIHVSGAHPAELHPADLQIMPTRPIRQSAAQDYFGICRTMP